MLCCCAVAPPRTRRDAFKRKAPQEPLHLFLIVIPDFLLPQDTGHYAASPVYASGPEGDPFPPPQQIYPENMTAPDTNGEFVDPPPALGKSQKKKRKGGSCWACTGDESRNPQGQTELMLSCADCGRCGMPSSAFQKPTAHRPTHSTSILHQHQQHSPSHTAFRMEVLRMQDMRGLWGQQRGTPFSLPADFHSTSFCLQTDFVMCDGCDRGEYCVFCNYMKLTNS